MYIHLISATLSPISFLYQDRRLLWGVSKHIYFLITSCLPKEVLGFIVISYSCFQEAEDCWPFVCSGCRPLLGHSQGRESGQSIFAATTKRDCRPLESRAQV